MAVNVHSATDKALALGVKTTECLDCGRRHIDIIHANTMSTDHLQIGSASMTSLGTRAVRAMIP